LNNSHDYRAFFFFLFLNLSTSKLIGISLEHTAAHELAKEKEKPHR